MSDSIPTSGLYLCCDCGGSKTAVAIANASGIIIGSAYGGPSNFAYLGIENFAKVIKSSVEAALSSIPGSSSQLPPQSPIFSAAWLGVSGVDSPANVALIAPVLSVLFSIPVGPRLNICNDTHLLAAPLSLHPDVSYAVGVIGGTGSIAASFREDPETGAPLELARFGGWGWILGDEGGGFHVGREAVRHLLREREMATLNGTELVEATDDSLRKQVLDLFGVSSAPELLALIHDPDPIVEEAPKGGHPHTHRLIAREKRLSQLSPYVFRAAFEHNDPLALGVLRSTSEALAEQVVMLLRPDSSSDDQTHPRLAVKASEAVVCFGGSLVGVQRYQSMVLESLQKRGHFFKHVEFVENASKTGAKGLAMQFGRRVL